MSPSRSSLPLHLFFAFLPLFVIPPTVTDPCGQVTWVAPKIATLLIFAGYILGGYPRYFLPPRDLVGTLLLSGTVLLLLSALRLLFQGYPLQEVLLGASCRTAGHGVHLLFFLAAIAFWNFIRDNREEAVTFLRLLPLAGAVEGVITLAQALGWDPLHLVGIYPEASFPVGTIGHPGMVASFLLPALLVFLGTWRYRGKERALLLLLLALPLGLLLNRTSLIALTVGALFFWYRTRSRVAFWAILLVWITTLGYQLIPHPKQEQAGSSKELASSITWQTRIHLWRIAVDLALRAPHELLLGYGDWGGARAANRHGLPLAPFYRFLSLEKGFPPPEDLRDVFVRKADTGFQEYVFLYEGEKGKRVVGVEAVDRFHNAYLDMAFAFGVPFALIWTFLFLGPILLLKGGRTEELEEGARAGLIGLSIYFLTWFPVPSVEMALIAFALSAFALVLSERRGEMDSYSTSPKTN